MKNAKVTASVVTGALLAVMTFSASALDYKKVSPKRADTKPDLMIIYVNSYYPFVNKIKVTFRNNNGIKSGSAIGTASIKGEVAQVSIPALNPYHNFEPELTFKRALIPGERIKIEVDSGGHVDESNENNNVVYRNY